MTAAATAKKIILTLKKRKLKISCAESCTGGLLADAFVGVSGASEVFLGSLVCYDPKIKRDVLGVKNSTIKRGVVSEECAKKMAKKARGLFKSDIALSSTGYAEKSDDPNIPDGTIFIALSSAEKNICEKIVAKSSRNANRKAAVNAALKLLEKFLKQ